MPNPERRETAPPMRSNTGEAEMIVKGIGRQLDDSLRDAVTQAEQGELFDRPERTRDIESLDEKGPLTLAEATERIIRRLRPDFSDEEVAERVARSLAQESSRQSGSKITAEQNDELIKIAEAFKVKGIVVDEK